MTRLLSTIRLDVLQQWRQGFYYAGAFVAVIFIVVLHQVNPAVYPGLLPGLVLMGLMITTFYFIAGLVLFEKSEGVLQALVVSPLRVDEYLGAKLVSLTFLAMIEQVAVVLLTYVWRVGFAGMNIGLLLLGMLITSLVNVLLGFIVIARFDSINEFLLPSAPIAMLLLAPFLHLSGLVNFPPLLLVPTGGAMVLLQWAFAPLETFPVPVWQSVAAIALAVIGIGVGYVLSRRTFKTFIVEGS
ncbi:MAG: ABC transporter permease [Anaerolineae bacterium]